MSGDTIILTSTAGSSGGALHIRRGKVTLTNIQITDSTAELSGGALVQHGRTSGLTVVDCRIQNSFADQEGGALYVTGGSVAVVGGSISDSRTGQHGGALVLSCRIESRRRRTLCAILCGPCLFDVLY